MSVGRPMVRFESGQNPSVQIGFVNRNEQRCCGTLGVTGTEAIVTVYKLECGECGYVYGSNHTEVIQRKCPNCQGGEPGMRFWLCREDLTEVSIEQNGTLTDEPATEWINRISGTFQGDPGFEDMVRYGREIRHADRPADDDEL